MSGVRFGEEFQGFPAWLFRVGMLQHLYGFRVGTTGHLHLSQPIHGAGVPGAFLQNAIEDVGGGIQLRFAQIKLAELVKC